MDYGKKYCHNSPSVEESILQNAIMNAVMKTAKQNVDVLQTLKLHIGMGLEAETTEDKSLDIQIRIAEIDAEFKQMLKAVSAENADAFDEERLGSLMNEKQRLTMQLEQYANARQKRESAKSVSTKSLRSSMGCRITRWSMMTRSCGRSSKTWS